MGRWSQRTRAGGGNSLNFIVFADKVTANDVELNYKNGTNVSSLTIANFATTPDDRIPTTLNQAGDTVIELEFFEDISDQDGIAYNGTIPSILNPQEKQFDA